MFLWTIFYASLALSVLFLVSRLQGPSCEYSHLKKLSQYHCLDPSSDWASTDSLKKQVTKKKNKPAAAILKVKKPRKCHPVVEDKENIIPEVVAIQKLNPKVPEFAPQSFNPIARFHPSN